MPRRQPRPLCGLTRPNWHSTPGPLGKRDGADPTHPVVIFRTRRQLGAIELAEAGEIVLADAGGKLSRPIPKAGKHKFNVVLTSMERGWYQWAKQFANKNSRSYVSFPKKLNRKTIIGAYAKAAKKAKNAGLIISAGHGFSGGFSTGVVDLAPAKKMPLSSAHFRIKADPNRVLTGKDKQLMDLFIKLGEILRKNKVKEVLFISCLIGRSHDFLQDIANEWRVTVIGYTKLVKPIYFNTARKYGIYLVGKKPKTGTDKLHAIREYPKLLFGDAWIITPERKVRAKGP